MVKGGKTEQAKYIKAWRAKHPHYHRDWMRKNRRSLHGWWLTGSKKILGVRCRVDLLRRVLSEADQ
jgi:hypothetical protein